MGAHGAGGRLAMRAEMGAAASDDEALDGCPAAGAAATMAAIDAQALLKAARTAEGVDIIGDRRASEADSFAEDLANRSPEAGEFLFAQVGPLAHRMKAGAPEAFVGVDVAQAAQHVLIEQERFYTSLARAQPAAEFRFSQLERIGAQGGDQRGKLLGRGDAHVAEAADIRVAKLAAVVEREPDVGVGRGGGGGFVEDQLASHAQMDDQPEGRRSGRGGFGIELEEEHFAVAADFGEAAAGEQRFDSLGLVNEIGFAETDGEDAAAGEGSEAAGYGFDFGKFGHGRCALHASTVRGWGAGRRAEVDIGI
jgi:hypothetical protein